MAGTLGKTARRARRMTEPAALPPPDDPEHRALAVLAAVEGIGSRRLAGIVGRHGGAAAALEAARTGSPVLPDGDPAAGTIEARIRAAAADPGPILERLRGLGVVVVAPGDAGYPARLGEIDDAPPALFVRGAVAALGRDRSVAVVGTRRPTAAGRATAARIARALARSEATVVSGLAVGIDGAAHAATVAERGVTVAVIGGGHGRLTPAVHAGLADAIVAAGGAIVSEHAPDTPPSRGTFPRRNRIVSGLADAVVVVEAGARSGALLTAGWALEQGRGCFVVPGSIDAPASAGCLGFLREWPGLVRIVAGVPQLLDDLGLPGAAGLEPERRGARRPPGTVASATIAAIAADLSEAEGRVAEGLARGATTVDELVAVTGLPVAAVLGAVTGLEVRGLAAGAWGRYRPTGILDPVGS
jgi:DNA processing protein